MTVGKLLFKGTWAWRRPAIDPPLASAQPNAVTAMVATRLISRVPS